MYRRSWFFKLIPVPKYLARPAAGLDISDRSIKFIQLDWHGDRGLLPKRFGEKAIPPGVIESGQIKQPTVFQQILIDLGREIKLKYIHASLPEEQAFVIKLNLPFMRRRNLRGSIELQLEEHVPLPAGEVIFDYEIMTPLPRRAGENYTVAVSIFPKNIAQSYLTVLRGAGLAPLSLEVEAQAIARAVVPKAEQKTIMIIDLGKTRTSFFVVRRGAVFFTSTVTAISGENITAAIQKNLGVDYETAERLKTEQGLLRTQKGNELLFALASLVSVLREESKKLYTYWDSHLEKERGGGAPISRILVCGGQSTLPGLVEYMSATMGVPVALGNVWTNILDIEESLPPLVANQAQKYTTALGLALKTFAHD